MNKYLPVLTKYCHYINQTLRKALNQQATISALLGQTLEKTHVRLRVFTWVQHPRSARSVQSHRDDQSRCTQISTCVAHHADQKESWKVAHLSQRCLLSLTIQDHGFISALEDAPHIIAIVSQHVETPERISSTSSSSYSSSLLPLPISSPVYLPGLTTIPEKMSATPQQKWQMSQRQVSWSSLR
eukprot:4675585-Amphidinium_carterae.1